MAFLTGAPETLWGKIAVLKFITASQSDSFGSIVTRPGKIVEKTGGVALVASRTPSFAAISFADLGAFTVGAVQDASLYGRYPFVIRNDTS
ncbi:hypothetical protein [Yoonia vestfoldensis]|uniref:hypothetical protein n=1 Tax=Yoonia vestfoldensis TaxID=245188 RepID=UPI00038277EE|nr:hypothetical protein [Yoonia vestfoldensis]